MLLALFMRPLTSFMLLLLYLIIGALGMPVFSGYNSGYAYLFSISAGFLYAFPLFAWFFSWLVNKHKNNSIKIFIDSLIAQIVLVVIGFSWVLIQNQAPIAKIAENAFWLLPGLLIKSILISLSNYVVINRLFRAKSTD
ncbi:biotin transporter BioY [Hyphobacterium sp. CCMP332]|nr:biotin transporter BioY [Hyphobacterium sp. CCMP332]